MRASPLFIKPLALINLLGNHITEAKLPGNHIVHLLSQQQHQTIKSSGLPRTINPPNKAEQLKDIGSAQKEKTAFTRQKLNITLVRVLSFCLNYTATTPKQGTTPLQQTPPTVSTICHTTTHSLHKIA